MAIHCLLLSSTSAPSRRRFGELATPDLAPHDSGANLICRPFGFRPVYRILKEPESPKQRDRSRQRNAATSGRPGTTRQSGSPQQLDEGAHAGTATALRVTLPGGGVRRQNDPIVERHSPLIEDLNDKYGGLPPSELTLVEAGCQVLSSCETPSRTT